MLFIATFSPLLLDMHVHAVDNCRCKRGLDSCHLLDGVNLKVRCRLFSVRGIERDSMDMSVVVDKMFKL